MEIFRAHLLFWIDVSFNAKKVFCIILDFLLKNFFFLNLFIDFFEKFGLKFSFFCRNLSVFMDDAKDTLLS